ncbi:MAG: alkaline phosphatase D family protein [Pseudomonadota bacterium]
MDRRSLLIGGLAASLPFPLLAQGFASNPFTLGVASSLPEPNAVTLWTRLAMAPLEPTGGMDPVAVPVAWELAEDDQFAKVVASGMASAQPGLAHSVRVTVGGLAPGRHYWYRFVAGDATSMVGRTKTLPADPDRIRFATASCQHYEQGFFVAYDRMIEDDPDFVLHLGDYIYGVSRGDFRNHTRKDKPVDLADYRMRHALYKTDPSLQRAHAAFPFFTVLDNHDALKDVAATPEALAQRSAAYQAWYEHMPMAGGYTPGASALYSHAGLDFGSLMRLTILDNRQFRDEQDICRELADPDFGFTIYRPLCEPGLEAARTTLGAAQEAWLSHRLTGSQTTWNAVSSTVLFAPFEMHRGGDIYHYDASWDYYPENRKRVLADMAQTANPVMLTADIHSNWAIDIKADPADAESQTVGSEFLATSISSGWPPPLDLPMQENLSNNPHVQHYDGSERGYLLHDVTAQTWATDMRVIDDAQDMETAARSQAKFVVEAGRPGVQRA